MSTLKALYKPQGRSGEYSQWAINFYNGCTGGCEYCFNRRFPILCAPIPTLKKCFVDEKDAFESTINELWEHKNDIIQSGGVFLSFVSDPCLPQTIGLTMSLLTWTKGLAQEAEAAARDSEDVRPIPVTVLTKRADWVINADSSQHLAFTGYDLQTVRAARNVAFGFTLTGHDELEPGCSKNIDRIRAIKVLHKKGYRTWASIEPIIDFESSLRMIESAAPFCDHFKIGIRTDRKFNCTQDELVRFVNGVRVLASLHNNTVYFKESFRDLIGGMYPIGNHFVDEGYNMFNKD